MAAGQEETMGQKLTSLREDYETFSSLKQGFGPRIASVKRDGASWRQIATVTAIPMTDARRWAAPHLPDEAGAA